MTILERMLTTLEKLDTSVRGAVTAVQKLRGATPETPHATTSAVPNAPVKSAAVVAKEPEKPIGDASIAVQIFGRATDPWTGRATLLLKDRDVTFAYTELDEPKNEKLAVRLETETKQRITPYVYIRGEFVGGFNALSEIERLGQLEEMVKTAEERARSGPSPVKIVIAKHGAEEAPPGERN